MKILRLSTFISLVSLPLVGLAQGTPWPDWYFSIGAYPEAGYNGIAMGNYSFSSTESFAFGAFSSAGWQRSVAMGYSASAQEEAISIGTYAGSADGAVALGYESNAYYFGVGLGFQASASGYRSIAIGNTTSANPESSIAIGDRAYSMSIGGIALGRGNLNKTKSNTTPTATASSGDPILMVGNAPSSWSGDDAGRANVLTIYRDGDAHFAGKIRVQPGGDIPMFSTVKPAGVSYP